jgi:hypothetical protein
VARNDTAPSGYSLEEIYDLIGSEVYSVIGNALAWVEYGKYWEELGGYFLFLDTPDGKAVDFGNFLRDLHLVVKRHRVCRQDASGGAGDFDHYRFTHSLWFDHFVYEHWLKLSSSRSRSDRYSALWAASWFDEWGDDALIIAARDPDPSVSGRAVSKMLEQARTSALNRAVLELFPVLTALQKIYDEHAAQDGPADAAQAAGVFVDLDSHQLVEALYHRHEDRGVDSALRRRDIGKAPRIVQNCGWPTRVLALAGIDLERRLIRTHEE